MVDVPVNQVTDVRDPRDVPVDGCVQPAEDRDVETVDVEPLAFDTAMTWPRLACQRSTTARPVTLSSGRASSAAAIASSSK